MSEKLKDNITGHYQVELDESKLRHNHILNLSGQTEQLTEGVNYQALLIASDEPQFRKRMVESSLNLVADLTTQNFYQHLSKPDDPLTCQGFDPEIATLLADLGRFTGYLVNSSSWHEQKLHSYDKAEFKNRLERVLKNF